MEEAEIISFLKKNIEPIENDVFGKRYRASVTLKGNLVIPCVEFLDKEKYVNQFIKRFDQKCENNTCKEIVCSFLTEKNVINPKEIIQIDQSRNAVPLSILNKIRGETIMSWTGFVLKMKDGKCFNYGTSFATDFFELPDEYEFSDIAEVVNHSYVDKDGEIHDWRKTWKSAFEKSDSLNIFRELNYFECYVNGIV